MKKIKDFILENKILEDKKELLPKIMFLFIIYTICSIFLNNFINIIFYEKSFFTNYNTVFDLFKIKINISFFIFMFLNIIYCLFLLFTKRVKDKTKLVKITDDIYIPRAEGEGQYGTAHFIAENEISNYVDLDLNNNFVKKLKEVGKDDNFDEIIMTEPLLKSGGIVLKAEKLDNKERYYINDMDAHAMILGPTRSGKSRFVLLQTIIILALAGENMIITDPKGEFYNYFRYFLKRLGYKTLVIDFKDFNKSNHFNILDPIIEAINENDIGKAQSLTWDLIEMLVPKNEKSDPVWSNGEMSIVGACILCVVEDNKDKPQLQTMTNVYYFLANMCKYTGESVPVKKYIENLPNTHSAKGIVKIADLAPEKMGASFYTSALTTLRLYATRDIYHLTKESDFKIEDLAKEKVALFFILPDNKKTYYSIATIMIANIYTKLIDYADKTTSRLKRRVNIVADEFGNFTKLNDVDSMFTASLSRGIRFTIVLQDYKQLDKIYGKEMATILKNNIEFKIVLKVNDDDTAKEISNDLGKYTVRTYGESRTFSEITSSDFTNFSTNYMERSLLTPDEVKRIARPYQLVSNYKGSWAVVKTYDFSNYILNDFLGLGDIEENRKIFEKRNNARVEKKYTSDDFIIDNELFSKYNLDNLLKNNEEDNIKEIIIGICNILLMFVRIFNEYDYKDKIKNEIKKGSFNRIPKMSKVLTEDKYKMIVDSINNKLFEDYALNLENIDLAKINIIYDTLMNIYENSEILSLDEIIANLNTIDILL